MTSFDHIHNNLLGGVLFTLISILIGVRASSGIRDYLLILISSVLICASIIERWFMSSSLLTSCLIGLSVGFVADDVYRNLQATLPHAIKRIIFILVTQILNKIESFFHRK